MGKTQQTAFLILFLPSLVFAQGDPATIQKLPSLLLIAAVMIAMIAAIARSRWTKKGKAILMATYLGSIVITQIYFWSILPHLAILTACLIFIPIVVVAINFLLFDRYFRAK